MKRLFFGAMLIAAIGGSMDIAVAAEIALRPAATPEGAVVRLGDVAEVRGAPNEAAAKMAALPLMPAPAPGTKQFLTARQIRDMLQAGGQSIAAHRFTGAAQVAISGETPLALARRVGRLTTAQLARVEEDLQSAIARHLTASSGASEPWRIDVAADADQLRQLAEASIPWSIEGGHAPWTGPQEFIVVAETPGGTCRLEVAADVTLPEPIVILTTSVLRGAEVGRSDVALTRVTDEMNPRLIEGAFHALDDVIGKVARRTLREGQVLTRATIEEPMLVRRGQTVRVVALSRGIRVTTFARARQPGAEGELIYVESLEGQEPFAALVCGPREVQVLGR
jgi:flagella basal body P-ring formation protein FlgA